MEPNKLISRRYKALISSGRDYANHKSFAINPHQRENRILSTKHSTSGERFSNPGLGSTKSHQRSQRILFESKPSYSLHQDNTVESFDIVNSKNQNSYESLSRTLNSRPSEKKVPFIKFNSNFLDSNKVRKGMAALYPSKVLSGSKKRRRSKQKIIESEQTKTLINENLSLKSQCNRLIEDNRRIKDQLHIAEMEILQKNKLLQDIINK